MAFNEAVVLNPRVTMSTNRMYPFVDMAAVSPSSYCVQAVGVKPFKGGGSRFEVGDTLMARITPCLENGKVARYCTSTEGPAFGSTEFIVVRGRKSVSDSGYVFYLTKSEAVIDYAISQMTGSSGRQRVPINSLSHLRVRLPSLPEQRAIARLLGSLDDKIQLNRRMSASLEALSRALFKSWFVDFDPVRAKSEGRDAGLPETITDLFPGRLVDSKLGGIPDGWEVGMLADIAMHPRRVIRPELIHRDVPYIALEHMPRGSIALSEWSNGEGLRSSKFEFLRREILFGKLRPYFHKVGVAPTDGVCSTDVVVISPKEPAWYGLVLGLVSSAEFVAYADAASTGTKMPRTNWSDMARYEMPLPPLSVAQCFTQVVSPAIERMIVAIHESHALAQLRDGLLPKLVSGEIRVRDAERVVGAMSE